MKRLEVLSKEINNDFGRLTNRQQLEYLIKFITHFSTTIANKDEEVFAFVDSIKNKKKINKKLKYSFKKKSEDCDNEYFISQEKNEPTEKWQHLFLNARMYSSLNFIIDKELDEALYELSTIFENKKEFEIFYRKILL